MKTQGRADKQWPRQSTNYCGGDLIKYESYSVSLEAYIFKNRGTLQDKIELQEAFSETTGENGVYFLFDHAKEKVYVGKTETKYNRLIEHNNKESEWYFNDWDEAILFTTSNNSMSTDEMENLEAIFIQFFKSVEDIKALNTKNERIKSNRPERHGNIIKKSIIDETKQSKYLSAIREKLCDLKILAKVISTDVEEITAKDLNILKQEVIAEITKTFNENKNEQALYMDKIDHYEDLCEKVETAGNRIVHSRLLNCIINKRNTIDEVVTPSDVARHMIELLPNEVFDGKHTFIDPASKSGIFLKLIIEKLMSDDPNLPINHDVEMLNKSKRLIHIIENLIFGISLSYDGLCVTLNTLFNTIDKIQDEIQMERGSRLRTKEKNFNIPHIICINNYIGNLKRKDDNRVKDIKELMLKAFITQGAYKKDMTFDVVIGNPPYQEATQSIYPYFIELGLKISNRHVCMITRNNWMTSDTLKNTRINMVNNSLKQIENYPVIGDIFNEVTPAVTVFNIDKNYIGTTNYKEIRNNTIVSEYDVDLHNIPIVFPNKLEYSVYHKVSEALKGDNFGRLTYPVECFGINSNGTSGRKENKIYLDEQEKKSAEYNVTVIYMDSNNDPYYRYIRYTDIPRRAELANKYKVACGCLVSNDELVIRNVRVADKMTVLAKSWGLLYTGDDLGETRNVAKYAKTKLFRFLVKLLVEDGAIGMSAYRFSLVPNQNFSNSSDIDWAQSISEIDQQLYGKYNLSNDEIVYIEQTIRAIN